MEKNNNTPFTSAGLDIDPQLGELSNQRGEMVRLTPINMKVLMILISKAGDVVNRNELFEHVWARQIVSDDTLTRCISDIRSQLRKISDEKNLIETLPKRGYRWLGDASDSSAMVKRNEPDFSNGDAQEVAVQKASLDGDVESPSTFARKSSQQGWYKLLISVLGYGVSLILIASVIVGLYGLMASPQIVRIAVLPTESSEAIDVLLVEAVNDELIQRLLQIDGVDVISRAALRSNSGNPFPYFFQQFGTQWVIESRIVSSLSQHKLSLSLVDARTASVVSMKTTRLNGVQINSDPVFVAFIADAQQFFQVE